MWPDCLPFDYILLFTATTFSSLQFTHSSSLSFILMHLFFSSIQKIKRCSNFTEIWLTLAAFREARANVLWRILNLDMWSSTDCEGENSSPHLIRHRDPDPNTELIEPVNASAPYHHATKGFLDANTIIFHVFEVWGSSHGQNVRTEKWFHLKKYQNQMTFFFTLKYSDRMYSTNGCFCICILGGHQNFWFSAVHGNF